MEYHLVGAGWSLWPKRCPRWRLDGHGAEDELKGEEEEENGEKGFHFDHHHQHLFHFSI